jgi:hypothetical protein
VHPVRLGHIAEGAVTGLGQIGVSGFVVGESIGQDLFRIQIVRQLPSPQCRPFVINQGGQKSCSSDFPAPTGDTYAG